MSMREQCKRCEKLANLRVLLRKVQSQFSNLTSSSKNIIYIYNLPQKRLEYISPTIESLLGYTVEETLAQSMSLYESILHPQDKSYFMSYYDHLVANDIDDSEIQLTYRLKHKKGKYIWCCDHITIQRTRSGKVKTLTGILRDITERKKLEQEIKASEQRYRDLYENARVALYRTRISDGMVLECNDMLIKLMGYGSREEFFAKRPYAKKDYANPKVRENLVATLKERGEVNEFEIETYRRDGSVLWLSISARLHLSEGYIEGAVRDITARKVLTSQEQKVLDGIMEGKSSKEIADEFHRSVRTIEDHRNHIMHKLGVKNLVELTKRVFAS